MGSIVDKTIKLYNVSKINFNQILNHKFLLIILTLLLCIFGSRFYYEGSVIDHIKKNAYENKTARIDIRGSGETDIEIIDINSEINVLYPTWCSKKEKTNCAILNIPIQRGWTEYNTLFRIKGKGKICLQKGNLVKSISMIIAMWCIFYSSLQDIRCQKAWYLQRQAELNMYNEAIRQVKTHPDFDHNKKYDLITIGKPMPMHDSYDRRYNSKHNSYFQHGMVLEEQMKVLFDFYESKSYLKRSVYSPSLSEDIKEYFKNKKQFPNPESILIKDDTIYINFDITKVK